MNKQNYYEVLDYFISRIPVLPFNNYKNIGDIDQIKDIISQDIFKEAVKVASSSLYESLEKDKLNENVIKAVMKYYSRIMLRTTPFGLFSGVSIGNFYSEATVSYDNNNLNKRIRVDYEWMTELIKKVEIEYKGYKKFTLYSSKLIEEYGDKIKNPMLTCFNYNYKSKSYRKSAYINNSSNIIFILNLLRKGAKYDDILKKFNEKLGNVNSLVIDKFLEELIKNEYIYTDVRPPLTTFNALEYIINKMESNNIENNLLIDLKKINLLILKYNELGNSCGIEILNEIESLMSKVKVTKSLIQVDSTNPFKIVLGKNVKDELTEVCNFLIAFSRKMNRNKSLEKFKNEFRERYGGYREIPILEVIDSTFGIGYEDYSIKGDEFKNLFDRDYRENIFKQKIVNAIGKDEDLVITEEDIENYGNKEISTSSLPESLEMYFSIESKDIDSLNNGDYKLRIGPNEGSLQAGRSLGRFSDLLSDSSLMYNEIKNKEKELLQDEYIQCELLSLNVDARATNVSITKNFRDFQVNITNTTIDNMTKNIEIDDIYVGVDKDKLYLKSKKYNKKIKVTTNHMLNTNGVNKVCKLMRKISEDDEVFAPSAFISYLKKEGLLYTPRVVYKNTILFNKTWCISRTELNCSKLTYKEFLNKFEKFKEEYKIPDLVYMKQFDLLLLIDLKIDRFKEILFNELKREKTDSLILQEADFSSRWLNYNGKYYANEFVFEFIKNNELLTKKEETQKNINNIYPTISDYKKFQINNIESNKRIFGVFSEWMYLKIYNNVERTKELLGSELNKFILELENESLIKKWFFIRYKDEKDHIRLRLNIKNLDKNYLRILEKVMDWREILQRKKLASKVIFDEYEREIERYGGEKVIDYAEEVFDAHSQIISEFLFLTRNEKLKFDEVEFGVCNIINLMNFMGIEYETQLEIFNYVVDKDFMRNDFTPFRKRYISLFNSDNEWGNLREDKYGAKVYSIINIKKDVIIRFGQAISEVDRNGELANSKFDILMSLIHMFCNRLYGIDREKEKKVKAFTRHTLYALRYFKRNK